MAVGTPKSNGTMTNSVSIDYPGKKSGTEVLSVTPEPLVPLWSPQRDNKLIFADNLGALATLAQDEKILGRVKLVYIDPPFATQSSFYSRKQVHAYEDLRTGSDYVEFLRERLIWLHRLLAQEGSLYLHIDERMVSYMRVVLDEIFGPSAYRNCITRKKCNPKNYTKNSYGNIADYILFYTKSGKYTWNRPLEPWTEERALKEYQYVEPETRRRYKRVPIHAPETRNGETGKPWRGKLPPPGKHWQYPPAKLDELDARGEIYWSPTGNPRRKVYLDDSSGIPVQDIWLDVNDAHNQNIAITGYPTEKPSDLLKRIILASSEPGDLVLDSFSGSGTTLAVADELDRRWIGIDNSVEAMRATLKRFAVGLEPMGDYVQRPTPSYGQGRLLEGQRFIIEGFTPYAESRFVESFRSLISASEYFPLLDCPKRPTYHIDANQDHA